jgi:superfamily II DNA/RNA helicase
MPPATPARPGHQKARWSGPRKAAAANRKSEAATGKSDRISRTRVDGPRANEDRPRKNDRAAPRPERAPRDRDRDDHAVPRPERAPRKRDDRPRPAESAPRAAQVSPRSGDRPATAEAASAPRHAATVDTLDLDAALNAAALLPDPPRKTFAQLGLPDRAVSILAGRGVREPFAIQARALPSALGGRDILARAATGCGKTLAFGLPMLVTLHGRRAQPHLPTGLVLAPTRELAKQIAEALEPVATGLEVRVAAVYGGAPIGKQIDRLRRGVDIVIATPGRLIDLMERNAVRLDEVRVAVVDEADHLADMGFLPDVTRILDATPPGRQCMLFSATLDRRVQALATRYLHDPACHAVAPPDADTATMTHLAFTVATAEKVDVAAAIAARPARTLFFVRTKHGADELTAELLRRGVGAAAIHGNLNQSQRLRVLAAFTEGRTRVMVATDVAARGLHIPDVDLVVHFDPPHDAKDYLHRSGRTARAGARGTVLSLMEKSQRRRVARLHEGAGVQASATMVSPGHQAVRALAESGEPIVITSPQPTRPRSTGSRRDHDRSAGSSARRSRSATPPASHSPRSARRAPSDPTAARPTGPGSSSASTPFPASTRSRGTTGASAPRTSDRKARRTGPRTAADPTPGPRGRRQR